MLVHFSIDPGGLPSRMTAVEIGAIESEKNLAV
jgi:hypothetical protein